MPRKALIKIKPTSTRHLPEVLSEEEARARIYEQARKLELQPGTYFVFRLGPAHDDELQTTTLRLSQDGSSPADSLLDVCFSPTIG